MNLLLDTHALIWALFEPDRLTEAARRDIVDPDNDVFVSAVTAWEIAINVALGKLPVPPDLRGWLPDRLVSDRFLPLAITIDHTVGVERLPHHHRDPFDRLLIAQALAEDLAIVSRDRVFQVYPVRVLPC